MLRRRTCSAAKSNDASNPAAIQLAPGFSFLLMTPGSMTACLCPLHVDRECFSTVAGHTIYIPIIFLIEKRREKAALRLLYLFVFIDGSSAIR